MSQSDWFVLSPMQDVNVYGGPSAGTQFSLEEACQRCGTGAEQVGPLRLKSFKVPKDGIFVTMDMEILVAASLAQRLESGGFDCFGPVIDTKTGEEMPVRQLRPQGTLPPFSTASTGYLREDPCPVCGRNGYFGTAKAPFHLVYETMPLSMASKDVLATWERFGTSVLREPFKDSVLARPQYVISDRCARSLKAMKVKQLELEPVTVCQ